LQIDKQYIKINALHIILTMKQPTTLFLKIVIFLIGITVLGLCLLTIPAGIRENDGVGEYRPILFTIYLSVIPFLFALYQSFKLLTYIDKNKAFSDLSVTSLKYIKYCAITVSLLYTASLPLLYNRAEMDDAPGVLALGLLFIFISIVIGTFTAVLQKLVQNAVELKSENDLTV